MDSINLDTVIDKDGEISINGLPFKKGDQVEITIKGKPVNGYPNSTAKRLRNSRLVGLWKYRTDIGDSVEFARKLRERAGKREW